MMPTGLLYASIRYHHALVNIGSRDWQAAREHIDHARSSLPATSPHPLGNAIDNVLADLGPGPGAPPKELPVLAYLSFAARPADNR